MFLAACYSSLLSSHAFPCWFPSLADCCTLLALSCLLLAFTFYHLTVHYSLVPFCCYLSFTGRPLFAVCFLFLAACLFCIISRRPNCMLLVNPKLANHISPFACGCCLSSPADRWTQLGTVPRYSLRDTRFLPITPPHSVAAGSSIFDQYCSLPTGHSSLVASNIMFFITRSSLKMPAILHIFITVFNFWQF